MTIKKIKISKERRFELEKPRYNAYQGGWGSHTKSKYSRKVKHKNKDSYD